MNKKAFTLVELIVVITILAILATVAFISFQGYGSTARDSTRLADINSIEKMVEMYNVKNSKYPMPDKGTDITYSGSIAWTQGVFGTSAYTDGSSMSNIPLDPITGLPYAYSVTAPRREYQIAAVLEQPITLNPISNTYAGTQEAQVYMRGNYNGKFLKVRTNTTDYILGVPSIIASDITSVDIIDIINNQKLVYKNYKNLPASFSGSIYNSNPTDGFKFIPNKVLLFEGNVSDLEGSVSQRIDFLNNLQQSYSGTIIQNESSMLELLSVDINISSPSTQSTNIVATLLNNSFKFDIPVNGNTVAQSTVIPDTVIGLVSNSQNESGFSLSWNTANNASSYAIYINNQYLANTTSNSTVLNGFIANTTYNINIIAKNNIGDAPVSTVLLVKTAPAPINDLVALGANEDRVGIAWTAVPGAVAYAIYRDGVQEGLTAGTTVTIGGLSQMTAYNFDVKSVGSPTAIAQGGNTLSFTTAAPAPNDITAVHISNDSIDISWTAVPGATSYAIYRGGLYLGSTTNTRMAQTLLSQTTPYSYSVVSIVIPTSPARYSFPSTAFNATTAATTLGPITNFISTAIGTTTADFSFDPLPGASGYVSYMYGYYQNEGSNPLSNILNIADLEPNTAYIVSINAKDGSGGFGIRQEISFTTNP